MKTWDSLARKLLSKHKEFGEEIKFLNGSGKEPSSLTVKGEVGHDQIASMWYDHYNNLLNFSKDTSERHSVLQQCQIISGDDFAFDSHCTHESIKDSIKDLKKYKYSGNDTLASAHYDYASSTRI